MNEPERINVPVEVRAAQDGPMLHLVALTEGRAARGGRAELFAPGAAVWPADGVDVLLKHYGEPEARAVPVRDGNTITLAVKATDPLRRAVDVDGKRYASVEFHALAETRTAAGVREIERCLITAVSLTTTPEYVQTRAEVRTAAARDRRRLAWL